MHEVKEALKIEEALRESEARFRRLTELMPMAVFSTDKDGLITFFNDKAVEFWGRRPRLNDPSEVKYFGSWKLYQPDGTLLPHEQSPMRKAMQMRKTFRDEEIIMERPDGKRINVRVNIDPVYEDDEVTGAVNIF